MHLDPTVYLLLRKRNYDEEIISTIMQWLFYVLLTVHLSIILATDQLSAQIILL